MRKSKQGAKIKKQNYMQENGAVEKKNPLVDFIGQTHNNPNYSNYTVVKNQAELI